MGASATPRRCFQLSAAFLLALSLRISGPDGVEAFLKCQAPKAANLGLDPIRAAPTSPDAPADSVSDRASPDRSHKVIVVGGGVGGLAIASRIAAASRKDGSPCNVTILEKNPYIGGRCGSFNVTVPGQEGTFRHERGPSLLLLPQVYHELFQDCGTVSDSERMTASDYGLEMKQCEPAYQVVFDDGDRLEVGFPRQQRTEMSKAELMSRRVMDSLEKNGSTKWDEYMRACEAYLDCGLPNFIEEKLDLASFPAFLWESLRDSAKAWPLKPHSDVVDAIFESDKMRALATFQDLYVGLEPYRNENLLGGGIFQSTAPAVFGLLAAIELHPTNDKCGVFAPIGGFGKVTDGLEQLALDLGVRFRCGQTVTKVTEKGVHVCDTKGQSGSTAPLFEAADLVVMNADLPYAVQTLLRGADENIPKYDWKERSALRPFPLMYSAGVIAFHWSLKKELSDLNTHNVFLAASKRAVAEESWGVLRFGEEATAETTSEAFNFYVHRASKTDPSAAPTGCDSLMVLVPCETLSRRESCADLPREIAIDEYSRQFPLERIAAVRKKVLTRMAAIESLEAMGSHIVDEVVDTPATFADKYDVAAGSPFGLSHGLAQLSLSRPGPTSSKLQNVVMVGSSARPGNGVPLVLIGAKQAADVALRKLREQDVTLQER